MLKKENRLTKKKDFELLFKEGKSVKQSFLYLKYKENNLEVNRFGIIVGKNFSKKAVERNKTRRRIREALRKRAVEIKQGFDIAIVVTPGADNDYENLDKEIAGLLEKSKLAG